MRTHWLVWPAVCAGALHAASIRGVVVENQTGRPLSQAVVTVHPVEGSAGKAATIRADSYGNFGFGYLPAGIYLLSASRPGFVAMQYGQKDWHASGTPIVLEENTESAIQVRLKRFGAISGVVMDQNDVGLPETTVVAYRNARPPVLVAKAVTDERGVYRIANLVPGSYLVRSAAKIFEEERYLPVFARQAERVDEAYPIDVRLDDESANTHVKPGQGRLLEIGGRVYGGPYIDMLPVTVTLISDMGSESVTTNQDFRFNPVAPGPYELVAETANDRRFGVFGGYMAFTMDRDRTDIRLGLTAIPELGFSVRDTGGKAITGDSVQVFARKRNLAGTGPVQTLKIQQGRKFLGPGRWELAMVPMADYYVSGFSGPNYERTPRGRPDGWNEITIGGHDTVLFTLTAGPGTLSGVVVTSDRQAAIGAPVFLEAYDPEERRRIKDVIFTRADVRGAYRFLGLAPGTYRVFSSFDFQTPDENEMDRADPRVVTVEAGRGATQELVLYVDR